ncbi:MAG: hypothetical protein JNG86_03295 [Verrucomicrobiaceae bacterium]|nr:hypothetical protein [Verrucomicrobiaceae bacterium]
MTPLNALNGQMNARYEVKEWTKRLETRAMWAETEPSCGSINGLFEVQAQGM